MFPQCFSYANKKTPRPLKRTTTPNAWIVVPPEFFQTLPDNGKD
jgi:hypothetical protein